jgi:5'-nucleotidase
MARDALLNVNVPAIPRERITGVEVTRLGKRTYRDRLIERLDPYGDPYYWLGGPAVTAEAEPGTDVHAIANGKISVTPIMLDMTDHRLRDELTSWDWGWSAPVEANAD